MKLLIRDNQVVCDISEPNKEFWNFSNYKYFYMAEGNFRPVKIANVDHLYDSESPIDSHAVNQDWYRLKLLTDLAKIYEVDVEAEVYAHLFRLDAERHRVHAEKIERDKRERAQRFWKALCSNGCGNCQYLKSCGDDDWICGASGDILACENRPRWDAKTHSMPLLMYKPFPSGNCLYKI